MIGKTIGERTQGEQIGRTKVMDKSYKKVVNQTCKALKETIDMRWGDRAIAMTLLAISMIGLAKTMMKLEIKRL